MPKSPISYYGAKNNMLKHILPLIPEHTIFTESFFGSGAVFFAKEPAESETINDIDSMVINFYEVIKTDFESLKTKVEATLFSRATYSVALCMYRMPHLFDKVQQAWALYIGFVMGFANNLGSWGYDKYGKRVKAFRNRKLSFNESFVTRLENVQIENNDACTVIESRDAYDAFHYVDPPYIHTDQGNYSGYSEADFIRLLETLSAIKGKFLLSSYPSELLDKFITANGWHTKTFNKPLSACKSVHGKKRKRKIEVLTANYNI